MIDSVAPITSEAAQKFISDIEVANYASNIVTVTDNRGIIVYVNELFCELSEYSRDELIWKSHNIVGHPDMKREVFQDLWSTISSNKVWKWVIKNLKKSGWYYWIQATIIPVLDLEGYIIQYISIQTDVTKLQESLKIIGEYETALSESNLVAKLDINGCITHANEMFCKTFWYKESELLGMNFLRDTVDEFTSKADQSYHGNPNLPITSIQTIDDLWQVLQGKNIWKGTTKNFTKQRLFIWLSIVISPLYDSNNNIREYIIIATDISDISIGREHLKKSFDKLKLLDIKKNDFLNIASHELRTPMTAIQGYIAMILEGDAGEINPEVHLYLTQVYASSKRLIDLINDMLDISKLESGKEVFEIIEADIVRLISDVMFELRPIAEQKQQKFDSFIDLPSLMFKTDINKFKQVLINLVGNAIKFTPEGGGVHLYLQVVNDSLIISIKDTGVGIPKDYLAKIFEKFVQVSSPLTRNSVGTWLGLSIAKEIVEQLWGYLQVESTEGEGSVFRIVFRI